jgi:hypothetical protein
VGFSISGCTIAILAGLSSSSRALRDALQRGPDRNRDPLCDRTPGDEEVGRLRESAKPSALE